MKKVIQVQTDDPERRQFNLVVTGPVEKIVDIRPVSVYLDGKPGETLEGVVDITPSKKFPFSILDMRQQYNKGIMAELIGPRENERTYRIKIQSRSDAPADLYDVLMIKTDSKYRPTITVRVYAIFFQPKEAPGKKNS